MKKSVYNRTVRALTGMIQNCLDVQKDPAIKEITSVFSPVGFINEFCTVKLGGPRRIGHTTSIYHVGRKLFGEDFVVFVPYENQKGHLAHIDPTMKVFTYREAPKLQFGATCIFVDNAFFLGAKDKENILRYAESVLLKTGKVVLVFLQ
jgi:hypothetical protein